jgi:hypothetical protein
MASGFDLVAQVLPPKVKVVKNQVGLLEKSTKKFGDIPKIFGAFKDKIGIEVEIENFLKEMPENSIYWVATPDGSLKKHGIELVSCPIGGHNIDYALHELREIIKNVDVEWSHRTSVHVHAGVGDLTMDQLDALVCCYAALEKLFFMFVEDHRRGNPYCYYLTDLSPEFINFGDANLKYCAFNAGNSLSTFNTVEFRHMQGTADFRLLRRWITLIVKLLKFIRDNDGKKVIERVQALNSTSEYQIFVKDIYKTSFKFFFGVDFQTQMEEGVLWAKTYINSGEL